MKVLMTGATGFIGRHVLERLIGQGVHVVVAGRRKPTILNEGYQFIETDLLDGNPVEITEMVKASHLLHLAWYTEHGRFWNSPLNLDWVITTIRLVHAFCDSGGKRVVAAGTCAEYDWAHGYCAENVTPLNPSSLYGVAKDATRRLLCEFCRDCGVSFCWGRIFFPYGYGESTSRIIPSLIKAFRGEIPPFQVSADAYRDVLHVSDVAEAFNSLLRSDVGGSVNISSGTPVKLGEIVRIIAEAMGTKKQKILDLGNCSGETRFLVGDNEKLTTTGWQQKVSLGDGLNSYIKEVLTNE